MCRSSQSGMFTLSQRSFHLHHTGRAVSTWPNFGNLINMLKQIKHNFNLKASPQIFNFPSYLYVSVLAIAIINSAILYKDTLIKFSMQVLIFKNHPF